MQSYTNLWSRVEESNNSVVSTKHINSLQPNKERKKLCLLPSLHIFKGFVFKSITYLIHFYNCDFHEKFIWVRVTIDVLKSIKKKSIKSHFIVLGTFSEK